MREVNVSLCTTTAVRMMRKWCHGAADDTGRNDILVHPVQEALDNAKGDEAPYINAAEENMVFGAPLLEGEALAECGI